MFNPTHAFAVPLIVLITAASVPANPPSGPLSPADAKASFELEPRLAVELVASEPLVASPCAVAWDERGRMFVVENRGYPVGGPGGKRVGVVALLEDTDADGLPDKRTEFATDLAFPNGVMPWKGGVIVTDAPDVLYLKDTDNDGKADVREVLLTGFATSGSTQLRVNDPTLGPDGWVYLAGGLVGGKVHSPKRPDKIFDTAKNDVKFRPDTGEIEWVDGKGQFGLTFDDAGHRFTCYNRVQVQHAPLPSRYLARNPKVPSPGVLNNCPDLVRNVMLGLGNDAGARIYPISANVTTADSHAGTYSAACAVHIARGDRIPLEYAGKAWSCEPTGNLVRYDALEPVGGSFHAKRVRDNVEALRSRDDWFRPVFLADGPDGALYVVDMYRKVIEHPEYLPEEVRKHTDFESGKDKGRVWRLLRSNAEPGAPAKWAKANVDLVADAATIPPEKLVTALRSDNGWTRDTAFRLVTERGLGRFKDALVKEATSTDAPGVAVIGCLNLLANAGQLGDDVLLSAMSKARPPDVRENAIRLSEGRLKGSTPLAARVLELAGDEHVHVRYAAVLAMREMLDEPADAAGDRQSRATAALAAVAPRDAGDKWFRAAILTSLPKTTVRWRLLTAVAEGPDATSDASLAFLHDLARLNAVDLLAGENATEAAGSVWAAIEPAAFDTKAAVLVGFMEGMATRPDGADATAALEAANPKQWPAVIADARQVATDGSAPFSRRERAVKLLALDGDARGEGVLLSLVSPDQPPELAVAAARALVQSKRSADVVPELLDAKRWAGYSPVLKGTLLTSVVGRPDLAGALVGAIESGAVPAASLTEPQKKWLRQAGDGVFKARAATLLSADAAGDRKGAYDAAAKAVLPLKPDPQRGRRVFMNHCSSCHRLDREGYAVGPDLYGIRSQPKESILLHIVVPEQEVAPNFAAYDCVTTDGRTLTGLLVAETPSSVTLRQVLGLEETIPRDRIRSLTASKSPLMPPGLEKAMKPQELADLLGYLRGEK